MQADIETVRRAHEAELMALPEVVGVGIGEHSGERVIRVFVLREAAGLEERIPRRLEGYRCEVVVLGSLAAEAPPSRDQ